MIDYNFVKFIPYQLNWDELKTHSVKVTSEISGKIEEKTLSFTEIVRELYKEKDNYKIESDSIAGWYVNLNGIIKRFEAETGDNIGALLKITLTLWKKNVSVNDCCFLYLGKDEVIDDVHYGYDFFIVCGDDIVEEHFSLSQYPGEKTPESVFKVDSDPLWMSHIELERQRIKLAYEKFYQSTYKGRLLDRVAKENLECLIFGNTIDTYGESLSRKELLIIQRCNVISKQLKYVSWTLIAVAIEIFFLYMMKS